MDSAQILDAARDAFVSIGRDGVVRGWNRAAEVMFGYSAAEAIGSVMTDLIVPDEWRQQYEAGAERFFRTGRSMVIGKYVEMTARRRSGQVFPMEITHWTVFEGDDMTVCAFIRDISDRKAAEGQIDHYRRSEERLTHDLSHDALTKLANRRLLVDRLTVDLTHRSAGGSAVVLLFVDLDRFKIVNDSLGHDAGDELLVLVSRRLRATVREADTVARVAGDEFVVLCGTDTTREQALAMARRINEVISEPANLAAGTVTVGASIGIAFAREDDGDAEVLLRNADAAMYRSKELGRGRITVFDDSMRRRIYSRIEMERDLVGCVDRDQLLLKFRPTRRLDTGELTEMHAMAFWQRGDGVPVPPQVFLPIAEKSGSVGPISRWVAREGSRLFAEWHERGSMPLDASTGVSARHVLQDNYAANIVALFRDSNLDPAVLNLTISTPTLSSVGSVADFLSAVGRLTDQGIRISLGWFGLHFTPLELLMQLEVDTITIAPAFIEAVHRDTRKQSLVAALVALAGQLGISVHAEGVDTEAEWTAVRALGCDYASGAYVGRLMTAAEVTELVTAESVGGALVGLG